jgi:hypothetical protein
MSVGRGQVFCGLPSCTESSSRLFSSPHRHRKRINFVVFPRPSSRLIQTRVTTFSLEDIWLDPDITRPGTPPQQLTGTFEWTYTVGDFENGSGQFLDVYVPWFGSDMQNLVFTIDLDSIEITMNGSYHGLGVDVTVKTLTDLDPNVPAVVDTANSSFHIEAGDYRGHMISGSVEAVVPDFDMVVGGSCPAIQIDIEGATPSGQVALLYAFGQGSFVVPGGPCIGTVLGLDSSVSLAIMLQADAAGTIAWNANVPAGACGNVFLQALDLGSCATSAVSGL